MTGARIAVTARHLALPMVAAASAEGVASRADAAKSAALRGSPRSRPAGVGSCDSRRGGSSTRSRAPAAREREGERHGCCGASRTGRDLETGPASRRARSAARREAWESVASSKRDGRHGDARIENAHEAESGRQRESERAGRLEPGAGERIPAERGEERERAPGRRARIGAWRPTRRERRTAPCPGLGLRRERPPRKSRRAFRGRFPRRRRPRSSWPGGEGGGSSYQRAFVKRGARLWKWTAVSRRQSPRPVRIAAPSPRRPSRSRG